MAYVITSKCIGTKDKSCVEVCPVDCIYEIKKPEYNNSYRLEAKGEDYGMLMIHPDQCIHCGACETECPVGAIYEDTAVPDEYKEFIEINRKETDLSDAELDAIRCTSKS
ncbi:MAG TPA: 4Fe-4S binding protein [Oligoflexia bacterium]|nr:4Fe-4S binding protein [Oligoflexia bacterium]HMP27574.1 4Fe-4S binding protein [Oligoflexia bacterium]